MGYLPNDKTGPDLLFQIISLGSGCARKRLHEK